MAHPAEAAPPPVWSDAESYVKSVKEEYVAQPYIYQEFLNVLNAWAGGSCPIPQVISRVGQLFEGRRHLIEGFNMFLPEGKKMTQDTIDRLAQGE
eukprot:TRINITY_DN5442_c0_g2_i1.p1 TRINITY_DN5442_c0_g2~~TRINITY_DN5442_c0_g2_i1.p1  ORF type:complete len:102 (-),score=13.95 TRINITY_DN5442_c0_g2_i1:84-368(-)